MKISRGQKLSGSIVLSSLLCLTLTTLSLTASAGSIKNTDHDFSNSGWSGGEICVACHTPHNANSSITDAPLWNHEVTQKAFTLYSSGTLDATVNQPSGSSKLCLSCHDGTVALDSLTNSPNPNGTRMSGNSAIGSDELNNDHPVSFTYNSALATTDGALHDPSTTNVTIGSGTDTKSGTIASVMLISGEVQCATCHDVHNKFTSGGKLLRIANSGSALCLTCHNK